MPSSFIMLGGCTFITVGDRRERAWGRTGLKARVGRSCHVMRPRSSIAATRDGRPCFGTVAYRNKTGQFKSPAGSSATAPIWKTYWQVPSHVSRHVTGRDAGRFLATATFMAKLNELANLDGSNMPAIWNGPHHASCWRFQSTGRRLPGALSRRTDGSTGIPTCSECHRSF